MLTVLMGGKRAVVLAVVTSILSGFGFAGTGRADTPDKKAGRRVEYAVMIHVTLEGKPVVAARVEIDTSHGSPVKTLKTDEIGVAEYKLTAGDYILTASSKDASNMVKITVSATSPVAVMVPLIPTTKP